MSDDATGVQREFDFLGARVLIVSPLPPAQDGIARYSQQLMNELDDRRFVRLALPGGEGEAVRVLWGGARPLWILRHALGVDDVLVMYHPDYYIQGSVFSQLAGYAALWLVSRLRRTTFVIHEPDHERAIELGRRGRVEFWLLERARRIHWRSVAGAVFHTEWERQQFSERFPGGRRRADHLVTHGSFFTPLVDVSPGEARRRLGLAGGRVLLLCIGFLSPEKPDKGYERAITAVGALGREDVELHVVGAPIARPVPEVERYVSNLRRLVDATPNVSLHERFVSDEEFDLWIRAADAVVVPYRAARSSGVVARTHLLRTRLIASGAGGIADQLRDGDVQFSTDEQLVEAMRRVADDASAA
jgi:glycosyltransferase involved in cell wall biosynthesis